ncbi:DNA recombination protein RmuC [Azoarcus taiwanensis]|uniref:DNA recombination protein RmuC n=2 Tax=Azoarcus taiwanensis TaxID=666964 RepID=A0A972F6R6_9RHOO|nr:DNA recombination protein RmuC [Azoarcus taiwanensis]
MLWRGRERRFDALLEVRLQQQAEAQHKRLIETLHQGLERQSDRLMFQSSHVADRMGDALAQVHTGLLTRLAQQREEITSRQAELSASMNTAHERLRAEIVEQMLGRLAEHARADRELLTKGMEALSRTIDERLEAIGGHVNQRLDEGFRKTNETFASVMARLATIDEAQKKIDGLTTNVVTLQELLGDKRARGAFGEVQLEALVRNMLPPDAYAFQAVLGNNTRVDCLLTLPPPTGRVAVDAKFPLENYNRMLAPELAEVDRRLATGAFRADVRRHIDAIADKYILAGETADGAVMFIPAEAVFAEIHAHHPELVEHAQRKRVWIVSPTTLMAVLNTARAVLKDVETRKQIHVIRDALGKLAKDFARFDERMAALARHIDQASRDVQEVQVSSRKISAHFRKIESAELDEIDGLDEAGSPPRLPAQPPM